MAKPPKAKPKAVYTIPRNPLSRFDVNLTPALAKHLIAVSKENYMSRAAYLRRLVLRDYQEHQSDNPDPNPDRKA